jgi:ribosome assembly protein YihI (activator of Der GTPase)
MCYFQPVLNDKYHTKEADERTQEETEREGKQAKEREHRINQTFTSSRYAALLEEESEDQQQKAGPENTSKHPIYKLKMGCNTDTDY